MESEHKAAKNYCCSKLVQSEGGSRNKKYKWYCLYYPFVTNLNGTSLTKTSRKIVAIFSINKTIKAKIFY